MKNRKFSPRLSVLLTVASVLILVLPGACSSPQKVAQIKIAIVGDYEEEWRPTTVSVGRGGTVSWFNNGNELHSVVSLEGLWSDRVLARGESFNFTFTQSGTFKYRDESDMHVGTVLVR